MREILFRGFHPYESGEQKVFVNGEWVKGYWVYGYYASKKETTYAVEEDYKRYPVKTEHFIIVEQMTDWGLPNKFLFYPVIPETVGQYTGLTDKNGTKIFEGDVVRYKKNNPCKIEYINCQFAMMWEKIYRDFEDVYDHDVEVIGNIHDNPELLKGG